MDTRAVAARPGRLPAALGAALVLCAHAQAQPAPAPAASPAPLPDGKRPKVCLVLSGGGARGAAHVGVLKVLEELRVPIDCVTGTSMGSIVGAAYASGIPIDGMEETLASMSTRLLFKDLPPREERATRLKRDDATNLAPVEIGLRDGDVLLPKGLVSGVQLESVLRRMSKVHGFHRFDDLPIPFRAVATDLVTGKPVVLSQGELAGAMRASMSVPGAIAPVRLEGRLLVDGGLTDNLPVGVARAMGADVVIAVNLGTPLLKAEQLTSVLGVTDQMVNILTEQNVQASLASLRPNDILILPQLGDFSAADFDHLPETVPVGEAAARAVADLLARLSVPQAQYDAWRSHRLAGPAPTLPTVDEIRFGKLQHVNPEIARSALRVKPGVPIDQEALDRDLRHLYGTGDFEHVNYQLLEEPGKRILAVDAVEKAWGPNYLRLGLGLVTDFRGDAYFNLLASYRMTWLNRLGGEWRSDVQFGRTNRISTEFYQPVETSQTFFVVPSAAHERRAADVFQGDQRVARYDIVTTTAAVEGGAQFTKYGEIRLGIETANVKTVLDTGPPFLLPTEGRESYTNVTLRGIVDQLDNVNFPRAGYAGSFTVKSSRTAWGSDASFTRGEMTGAAYRSVGEHTFSVAFRFTGRLGSEPLPASQLFQWGGLLQQSGYPTGALLGEELMFARLVYLKRLARWSLLDGVYAGASLEIGRMRRPLIPDNEQGILRSMALLFGLDTPVGPLYLGYGRVDRGFESLYLFLGKP
jgi:NTE family protein